MTIDIIEKARNRFDPELHTDEYKKIHSNDEQLDLLIKLFEISDNERYFDLGTGNGYVGFELAKRFKYISVVGVDIANKSIDKTIKLLANQMSTISAL